jgi:putative transposase
MARVVVATIRARAEHHWSPRVRLQARIDVLEAKVAQQAEELRIKDARMGQIDPRHRPHYPPQERLRILEQRAAFGWSQEETAQRFLVSTMTIHNWMRRLDDEGPDALVQVPVPVNRFPAFVAYIVQRLRALCPKMGDRRIAQVLARACLHLGSTTVRRMRKPPPKRNRRRKAPVPMRSVTTKRPNHLWHVDLTIVPTVGGFWLPWMPFPMAHRWPYCWWVAVVIDHFSRRALGKATFKKEPSAADVEKFLDRATKKIGARPKHMITDRGRQFTADVFEGWLRLRKIDRRFGAVGKYGSVAVIERFIKSMKNECVRLLAMVPLAEKAFGRELDDYLAWYNAERPHTRLGGRTPDEVYFNRSPACRKPRFEPREFWPRRSRCAGVQAPIRGRPGARLELSVAHFRGRKHLPIVTLRRVA